MAEEGFIELPDKRVVEELDYAVDFTDRLEVGEVLIGPFCVVQIGTVTVSSAVISGNKVVGKLTGGTPGHVQLSVGASVASGARKYSETVFLRILA